jgi:hypothetical protein
MITEDQKAGPEKIAIRSTLRPEKPEKAVQNLQRILTLAGILSPGRWQYGTEEDQEYYE